MEEKGRHTFRRRRHSRTSSAAAIAGRRTAVLACSGGRRDGASGAGTLGRAVGGGPAEAQLGLLVAVGAIARFGGRAGRGGFTVAGGVGAGAFVLVLLGGFGNGGCGGGGGGGVGGFGGFDGRFDGRSFAVGGGDVGPGGGLFGCGGRGWGWGAGTRAGWDGRRCTGWLRGGEAVFLFVFLAGRLGTACFGEVG